MKHILAIDITFLGFLLCYRLFLEIAFGGAEAGREKVLR